MADSQFEVFLGRALERRTFTPLQIVDKFYDLLTDDKILDQTLGMVLCTFMCFSHHPQVMAARVAQTEMPFVLVFAAQRQVCSGKEEEVVHVLRIVFRAIGYGFNSG